MYTHSVEEKEEQRDFSEYVCLFGFVCKETREERQRKRTRECEIYTTECMGGQRTNETHYTASSCFSLVAASQPTEHQSTQLQRTQSTFAP